ncbi:MAG: tetratricopeptide repeat protein [Elusimicrobia bacterium]|nr:tetratricopeptide repeat protein [Elusimicrobiota bacterium]
MKHSWLAVMIAVFFAWTAAPAAAQPEDEDNPVEAPAAQEEEAPAQAAAQAQPEQPSAPAQAPAVQEPEEATERPEEPAKPAEKPAKPAAAAAPEPVKPSPAPEKEPQAPAPKSAPTPLPSAQERAKAELSFLQSTFKTASEDVLPSLVDQIDAYLWEFREIAEADQAQFLKAQISDKQGDMVTAAVDLLKLLYEYPQTEYKMNAKKRLFEIIDKKFGKKMKPVITELAKGPAAGLDRPQRFALLLRSLVNLKEAAFYQPLILEFREFFRRYASDPSAGEMTYLFGRLHFQDGNYKMSVIINEKLLAVHKDGPLAAKAQASVGDIYATAMRDYNKAIEAYQVVTKKFAAYPEAGDAYVKMAKIFDENLKQPDLALETLDKIVLTYPGADASYQAFVETARIQKDKNKDFGKAVAALQNAAKMFKNEERAAAALRQASVIAADDLKDDTLQAQLLKDVPANCPQCRSAADSLWEAGQVYEKRLKAPAEALKAYKQLVSEYPGYARIKDVNKRIAALSK